MFQRPASPVAKNEQSSAVLPLERTHYRGNMPDKIAELKVENLRIDTPLDEKGLAQYVGAADNVFRTFYAVCHHPLFKQLHLGVLFCQDYRVDTYDGDKQRLTSLPIESLVNIPNLRSLTLDIHTHSKNFFKALLRYLADPKCQITSLTLNGGLTPGEMVELREAFLLNKSLQRYMGPDYDAVALPEKNLQAVLSNKQQASVESSCDVSMPSSSSSSSDSVMAFRRTS